MNYEASQRQAIQSMFGGAKGVDPRIMDMFIEAQQRTARGLIGGQASTSRPPPVAPADALAGGPPAAASLPPMPGAPEAGGPLPTAPPYLGMGPGVDGDPISAPVQQDGPAFGTQLAAWANQLKPMTAQPSPAIAAPVAPPKRGLFGGGARGALQPILDAVASPVYALAGYGAEWKAVPGRLKDAADQRALALQRQRDLFAYAATIKDPRERAVFLSNNDAWGKATSERYGVHSFAPRTTNTFGDPSTSGSVLQAPDYGITGDGQGYNVTPDKMSYLGELPASYAQQTGRFSALSTANHNSVSEATDRSRLDLEKERVSNERLRIDLERQGFDLRSSSPTAIIGNIMAKAQRGEALDDKDRAALKAYKDAHPDNSLFGSDGYGDEGGAGGEAPGAGAGASSVPTPQSQADFDRIPKGAIYRNPADGKNYRKK